MSTQAPLPLADRRFGKLLVLDKHRMKRGKTQAKTQWLCRCDCGCEKWISRQELVSGKTKTCRRYPCTKRGGMRDYRAYKTWRQMKSRCLHPKSKHFKHYGGRGITICKRWLTFRNFLGDMGDQPPGASIHRIDNDGNYEPGNCKWSNPKEQARNRRSSRLVEHGGLKLCLAEWEDRLGLPSGILRCRLYRGWPAEKALSLPKQAGHSRQGGARSYAP